MEYFEGEWSETGGGGRYGPPYHRLLTTTFANTQIPPHVLALDMIDRATVERSPIWPRDSPYGAGLHEVLGRLVGEYNDFMENKPLTDFDSDDDTDINEDNDSDN